MKTRSVRPIRNTEATLWTSLNIVEGKSRAFAARLFPCGDSKAVTLHQQPVLRRKTMTSRVWALVSRKKYRKGALCSIFFIWITQKSPIFTHLLNCSNYSKRTHPGLFWRKMTGNLSSRSTSSLLLFQLEVFRRISLLCKIQMRLLQDSSSFSISLPGIIISVWLLR